MLFSLLKHHLDLNITDTVLKVSRSLYCFTTSISHGVENYFPRLWGTGISDAIFISLYLDKLQKCWFVTRLVYHNLFLKNSSLNCANQCDPKNIADRVTTQVSVNLLQH